MYDSMFHLFGIYIPYLNLFISFSVMCLLFYGQEIARKYLHLPAESTSCLFLALYMLDRNCQEALAISSKKFWKQQVVPGESQLSICRNEIARKCCQKVLPDLDFLWMVTRCASTSWQFLAQI